MNMTTFDNRRLSGPTSEAAGMPPISVHTVLIALRCWWHVAVPLGLLLAAAAAAVVYYTTIPTYTASAWVLIRARAQVLVQSASSDDSGRFIQNQIELMRSPPVLDPVCSDPAIASTPELASAQDPVGYVRSKLRIRSLGQSDYFVIEFSSRSPEKAKLLVNKVAHEYLSLQDKDEKRVNNRTIELLQLQQQAQMQEVKRLRDVLQELSKQMFGRDAFPVSLPNGEEGQLPERNPLADIQQQLITAEVEQVATLAAIQAEQELFLQENFEPAPEEVTAYLESLPDVQLLRDRIRVNEAKVAGYKDRGTQQALKGAPFTTIQTELQRDKVEVERLLAQHRPQAATALEKSGRDRRQSKIIELQAQEKRLGTTIRYLADRLKGQRSSQQQVAGDTLQFEFARADYDRANEFLDAISNRILMMQTEQRAPERVEIFREADIPTRPDEAVPYKMMGLAGGAAFMFPLALALGIEVLFRRVSNRQQLEAAGQISVVAEVTSLPARVRSRKQGSDSGNRELQLFEESVDGLRTYLSLVETMKGRKVLAVTSAISREGKTSLASQLAVSIAGATNRPTLLIDGDMRSPDVHRIFDVERGPGLTEVLKGECSVEEALETGFSDTLHLLTAGDLDMNPHRLMSTAKFAELLSKLREMYDCIVIDTPPILPASESLVMASAADAAILCVRRDFSRVDQVADAFARLRAAGVQTAGAVLNGIPPRHYSYRYGSYYYNRHRYPNSPPRSPAATSA